MRPQLWIVTSALTLLLALLCCATGTRAQVQDFRILSRTILTGELLARGEVAFDLDGVRVSETEVGKLRVRLESLPSGELLDDTRPTLLLESGHPEHLIVRLGQRPAPNLQDKQIKVSVYLPQAEPATQMMQSETEREMLKLEGQLFDLIEETAKSQVAYQKTSREKHLYLSGGLGGGEAAVNPVLYQGNVWNLRHLINQIDLGLNFDKGTGSGSDPDYMNLGLNFRKIIPLHRGTIQRNFAPLMNTGRRFNAQMNSASDADARRKTLTQAAQSIGSNFQEMQEHGKAFFRAIVLTPLSPRLETNMRGHHAGFLINFVNNTEVQVRTGIMPLFNTNGKIAANAAQGPLIRKQDFTWEMKLIPIGFESGLAIRNPDDPRRKGSPLFRLNTGAVAKLTYHPPCRLDQFVSRMELEMKGMNRHLFNDESALNPLTGRTNALVRGNKYALQVDYRFVFGYVTPLSLFKRRPAITVSYKNGFFPPIYAYNNSVSVHFTFVSVDDTNVNDMKLEIKEVEAMRARVSTQ
jgi:hypothetical protein